MIVGGSVTGRLLDMEYRRFKEKAQAKLNDQSETVNLNREENFPLEKVSGDNIHIYLISEFEFLKGALAFCPNLYYYYDRGYCRIRMEHSEESKYRCPIDTSIYQ